eukprot:IDg23060t1
MSSFIGDLRWASKRMNEQGLLVDYHNNEFDYYRHSVRRDLYVPIPDTFHRDFCSPNGFWPCLPPVLAYRAEVFVDADAPWASTEGTIFCTEYAVLYAVTWLREVYGCFRVWYLLSAVRAVLEGCRLSLSAVLDKEANVEDLFALMAVEATAEWDAVPVANRAGQRPAL